MARFLFASMPLIGHINPGIPIVRELVNRGHEVGWYTGKDFKKEVEATGARFFPRKAAPDFNALYIDEMFPEKKGLRGLASLKFDVKHLFLDSIPGHLADLTEIFSYFPVEVVVSDAAFFGMEILHKELGCGWAAYGISCLCSHSADVPPFGSGIKYCQSALAPMRNRLLNYFAERVVGRDVMKYYNKIRSELELESSPHYLANVIIKGVDLFIQPSIPGFEYPRNDLPRTVHFVGIYFPQTLAPFLQPGWWEELHSARTVVHVTQGTLSTDYSDLLIPTLQALARENCLVVAATGGKPVEQLGMDSIPDNVRLAPFIPYQHLLPLVDVMITNGGYGGVQLALANGVPLVGAGQTEEKPEICARIHWSGAGINLKTHNPAPARIRKAIKKVLETPSFRNNAQRLKAEYRLHDSANLAADLLEQLAYTKRPILRLSKTKTVRPQVS
ncbi:MAG: glycosyltransferase [Methylobacter sp.]|nr:glycosyltransferase [Methylobacter sp.]